MSTTDRLQRMRVLTEVAKLQRAASETACATMMPGTYAEEEPSENLKS
jgi:hypothetical protein